MRILSLRTSYGPNVYHRLPIITMKIDLENWADLGSHEIPGFTQNLISLLPGLQNHTCSPGHIGGFVKRLERGTYMDHIIEHIALELSEKIGQGVTYGKTKYAGQHRVYSIVTRFENEEGMKECLRIATDIAEAMAQNLEFDINSRLKKAIQVSHCSQLGPSSLCIINAAIKKNSFSSNWTKQLNRTGFRKRLQNAFSERSTHCSR